LVGAQKEFDRTAFVPEQAAKPLKERLGHFGPALVMERRNHVKKNKERDQDQKGKPRRLILSRETIQILDRSVLELARGGIGMTSSTETRC